MISYPRFIPFLFATLAFTASGFGFPSDDHPNFVFILGEGQGWASTSVQLDPQIPESKSTSFSTPNLERLAREGIRFSNFYAPSPRCTPSRATYFTGLSPAKLQMTFTSPGGDTGRKIIEPRVVQELPPSVKTIADLAGVSQSLPANVEGASLRKLLADPVNATVDRKTNEFVFHFPHYDKDSLGPVSAILVDHYKLIRVYESDRRLLFDVSEDMGEQNDLAASMTEKVRELDERLTKYLDSINAKIPTVRSGETPTDPLANRRSQRSRSDPLLEAVDVNNDKTLTVDELERLPELLRSLDANGDGSLSRDELNSLENSR